MLELALMLYFLAVLVSIGLVVKYSGFFKSSITQLVEKRALTEKVMRVLNSMSCPFCGSRDTHPERVDLFQSNIAIIICNHCGQKAMWQLKNKSWQLMAPYRFRLPPSPTIPTTVVQEEELKLEFNH
jgi:hypothetical protein